MNVDIASMAKSAIFSAAVVAVSGVQRINELSIPLLGVPLTAVTMAAAGAICAFAWPRAETSRPRLFAIALASTLVGAACVTVIPTWLHTEWPKELQAPLAFLFGLLSPWVVPAVRTAIPSFVKGLGNLIYKTVSGKVEAISDAPTADKSDV